MCFLMWFGSSPYHELNSISLPLNLSWLYYIFLANRMWQKWSCASSLSGPQEAWYISTLSQDPCLCHKNKLRGALGGWATSKDEWPCGVRQNLPRRVPCRPTNLPVGYRYVNESSQYQKTCSEKPIHFWTIIMPVVLNQWVLERFLCSNS